MDTDSEYQTGFEIRGVTKRAVKACAACRARKSRCDTRLPRCSHCAKNKLRCDYEAPVRRPQSTRPGRTSYSKWWKTTLEDTLEWPIIGFKGARNDAIETTMTHSPMNRATGPLRDELKDPKFIHHLVKLFIEEVHTKNPILDITQIQKDSMHVLDQGIGHDEESCFVLLYCALGSISCAFSQSALHSYIGDCTTALRYANHSHYFAAAQALFGSIWKSSRLRHAQGLFLAGVYLMYDLKPWQALETFRMASSSCYSHMMTLRVTRKAQFEKPGVVTDLVSEFEPPVQRLYWSCLKSETELAHEYGLEQSILTHFSDPPLLPTPPNPLTADNIFISGYVTPSYTCTAPNNIEEKSWYYYLTEISLRKLEIQIHASFERLQDENWHLPIEKMSSLQKTHLQDFLQCIINGISEFETQLQSCWERLSLAMDINLDHVTIGCSDELAEYLRIKLFWIKHDLLRIALTMVLYFESEFVGSSLASAFPALAERLFGMANRGLVACVTVMQIGQNTHRNHGSWFGPRITVMCALEVVAVRKFGNPNLKVPGDFDDAARSLVEGLKWWKTGIPDAGEYLKILSSLDPIFEQ
ncbi:hypothetical protein N7490_007835 [Penicillium lividum]|nr:hypothetical protein N7490_007835 [Penicillium lividum]